MYSAGTITCGHITFIKRRINVDATSCILENRVPFKPMLVGRIITNACLYNIDPLKPHFYIVKLGFTGVYIIFLISAQNIDFG